MAPGDNEVELRITAQDQATKVMAGVRARFKRLSADITKPFKKATGTIQGIFQGFFPSLGGIVRSGMSIATSAVRLGFGVISGIAKAAFSVISTIANVAFKALSAGFHMVARVGTRAFQVLSLAAGIAFGKILYDALRFEQRMAEAFTLIPDAGVAAFERLKQGAIDMSRVLPQSPSDLSVGLYDILSAGITGAADAMKVLEVGAKGAVAGVSDTKTSVSGLLSILSAWDMKAAESMNVMDAMFATVKYGRLTFSDLAQGIGMVAGPAAIAGVAYKEMLAALATATKVIRPETAFVGLAAFLKSVTKPTKEAAGLLDELGLKFWRTGKDGKQAFVGIVNAAEQFFKLDLDPTQLAQLFPEQRAYRFVTALQAQQAALGGITAGVRDSAGATETAFKRMMETSINQLKILWNNIAGTGIEIFNAFGPTTQTIIEDLTSGVAGLTEGIKDLIESGDLAQWAEDAYGFMYDWSQISWGATLDALDQIKTNVMAIVAGIKEGSLKAWFEEATPAMLGLVDTMLGGVDEMLKASKSIGDNLVTAFNLILPGVQAVVKVLGAIVVKATELAILFKGDAAGKLSEQVGLAASTQEKAQAAMKKIGVRTVENFKEIGEVVADAFAAAHGETQRGGPVRKEFMERFGEALGGRGQTKPVEMLEQTMIRIVGLAEDLDERYAQAQKALTAPGQLIEDIKALTDLTVGGVGALKLPGVDEARKGIAAYREQLRGAIVEQDMLAALDELGADKWPAHKMPGAPPQGPAAAPALPPTLQEIVDANLAGREGRVTEVDAAEGQFLTAMSSREDTIARLRAMLERMTEAQKAKTQLDEQLVKRIIELEAAQTADLTKISALQNQLGLAM